MNKIILLLIFTIGVTCAKPTPPKMGCILSQQGKVLANWTIYGEQKLGKETNSTNVKYTAIKKEGINFHQLLVGSTIQADFQDKKLLAKIIHIQSKKRIARGPRHGVMVFNISLNDISKDVPMIYFYETGDMSMKSVVNLKDFNLSEKDIYAELSFNLQINSVVCAMPSINTK